ncbi:hypothetical protein FSP39_020181, partial [Pinctada imbricata]
CEIRPGPEFLLRKYKFRDNHFSLHQYYYEDPGCSIHSHGVVAEGEYKTRRRSWIVPGGTEVRGAFRFRAFRKKKHKKSKKSKKSRELFLGDIHTDMQRRHTYRPAGYQAPLKESKVRKCHVCTLVANSNDFFPPKLSHVVRTTSKISGDWISRRCEVRQYGQFLTRQLTFYKDHKSWQGYYHFYNDPLCSVPSYSLFVKGNFVPSGRSKVIHGAWNYNFRLTRLKVTLKNQMMVKNFNFYSYLGCGNPQSWKLDVEQDVTSYGGCALLGISLPNNEFEIVMTKIIRRKRHLFIGQRPTDGGSLSTLDRRPTSFQDPLVQCKGNRKPLKLISNEIPTFEMLKQMEVPTNHGNPLTLYINMLLIILAICFSH